MRLSDNVAISEEGEYKVKLVEEKEGKKDMVFEHSPHAVRFVEGMDGLIDESRSFYEHEMQTVQVDMSGEKF